MGPNKRGPLRPTLPTSLLEQMGGEGGNAQNVSKSRGHHQTRKDRRKADRVQKRQQSVSKRTPSGPIRRAQQPPAKRTPEQVENLVKSKSQIVSLSEADEEDEDEHEEGDEGFEGFSEDDAESEDDQPRKPNVSKVTKEKLSKDDAEIAELERKLGIKNHKSLPKSFDEDGLGDLLVDLNDNYDEDDVSKAKKKRKAEADDWLAQKRRKAIDQAAPEVSDVSDDDLDGLDNLLAGSDLGSESDPDKDDMTHEDIDSGADDSQSLGSDVGDEDKPIRKRENPYVAPMTSEEPVPKYIPPARRQEIGSDAELLSRIRRQVQGLINRLTEPNLLTILGDIEKLYREHPRQHVTAILIDLILVQICEPTSLPDTLLILYAGFSTAAYHVIGPDFGAQLIQHTVERFNDYHAQSSKEDTQTVAKYTSNLATFMSQMYNFQLIGCTILFDYIRVLLNDLTELNAELLLRIVRMAGQSLRRDDPLALKDIVVMLGPAVKKVGEANLSVRTKFLIESINDLKNNKVKTGASASTIVREHVTRIKKLLGSMKKAREPLRITLKGIEDSDERGKWWLVGASWAGRDGEPGAQIKGAEVADEDDDLDSIFLDSDDEPTYDLDAIAREQNMNTDVRRAIFITIVSSSDYEDAYARLMKLRLNKNRLKEVAYVVTQCAGSERPCNPYYSFVARRLCGDSRIKFAFQDSLWKFFRRLGELPFGEDADADDEEEEEDETVDVQRVLNVARMFGFLIANGAVGLKVLKCLNLAYIKPKARDCVEIILNTLFLEVKKTGNKIANIFGAVADTPELSKGLQYFLKKRVLRTKLVADKKEGKKIKKAAQKAIDALKKDAAADPKFLEATKLDDE